MRPQEDWAKDAIRHAERLLDMMPGGFPQPYSKLGRETWRHAARLFAARGGQVKLRELCDACRISYRTAWRIREALRDSAQVLRESASHEMMTCSTARLHH
jgi:hypothetical protein